MDKPESNSASNSISPHNSIKREGGSVVDTNANKNQGGFRPAPDKTVLGTMNSIMADKYNKK
jgi:hypothetical protein|tara:strand:- start:647 stop:832 length:186 start_codon:yes stop_codon:yes gene_type:complete